MLRNVYRYIYRDAVEVGDNKQKLIVALTHKYVLAMRVHHPSVAVYVHQIEELAFRDGFLFVAQCKYGLIEMTQFFLLVVKQVQVVTSMIAPTANTVYAPVIEYSGASVSSDRKSVV